MGYQLTIPDVPPSLNKVLRMHWAKKGKLRDSWTMMIKGALLPIRPPQGVQKAKMRVVITFYNARAYDRDNAFGAGKVIFDVLRRLNLIFDDRPEWLDAEVRQEKSTRKDKRTVIEVEPCASRD
jgi:hypothetical protein